MRQVISLSLPQKQASQIKTISKQRGFFSVSHYINYLFEADQDLISEKDLLKMVNKARKEYRAGKTIRAKSMAELV